MHTHKLLYTYRCVFECKDGVHKNWRECWKVTLEDFYEQVYNNDNFITKISLKQFIYKLK